jgi:hypothetical protein
VLNSRWPWGSVALPSCVKLALDVSTIVPIIQWQMSLTAGVDQHLYSINARRRARGEQFYTDASWPFS